MQVVYDTLIRLWLFDIWVLSHPWMYYPLLVPAACYSAFMVIKWFVLTAPLWVPFRAIIKGLTKISFKKDV